MLLISKDAHSVLSLCGVRKFHGTTETLVLLGIVVLDTNLEFYGLYKGSLLDLNRGLKDVFDALTQLRCLKFANENEIKLGMKANIKSETKKTKEDQFEKNN
jgi:hypothetical protein